VRIAVFLQEDYDFTFRMVDELADRLAPDHELAGIATFPDKLTKYRGADIYRKYLEIFGPGVFAKLGWNSMRRRLALLIDRLAGRRAYWTFDGLYARRGVPRFHFRNPNDPEVIDWVKGRSVDVILIFIGYILKTPILQAPKICVLNKHAACLPADKGVFPVFWALLEDEPIGVTIHKVNEGIDEGEIILQKTYDRVAGWSVSDYYRHIYSEVPDLMVESLRLLASNARRPVSNPPPPSYHGLPTRQDYLAFRKRGFRFV